MKEMMAAFEVVGFGAEPCSARKLRDGPLVDGFCPVCPPWGECYAVAPRALLYLGTSGPEGAAGLLQGAAPCNLGKLHLAHATG